MNVNRPIAGSAHAADTAAASSSRKTRSRRPAERNAGSGASHFMRVQIARSGAVLRATRSAVRCARVALADARVLAFASVPYRHDWDAFSRPAGGILGQ
jgi:hypothetical protein